MSRRRTRRGGYGIINFIFDVLLFCLTGGMWGIWIFVREMRKR